MLFPKRILIIDDEPRLTAMVRNALEACGRYIIQEENHSRQGLQTARRFRPDLVLLDVLMPELDGRELARQMQADLSLQDVPVLFISGLNAEGKMESLGFLGGYSFIAKPFELSDLLHCVEEMLGEQIVPARRRA